jgi:hypothetical protein
MAIFNTNIIADLLFVSKEDIHTAQYSVDRAGTWCGTVLEQRRQ